MDTLGTTGSPYDVINVNGSAGGGARLVTLAINTPMTISVLQPPTNTFPTNHLIFGKIGFPDAAGTFPVPFPLQFTLQGVMEESPGLLAFTNAVMVDIK